MKDHHHQPLYNHDHTTKRRRRRRRDTAFAFALLAAASSGAISTSAEEQDITLNSIIANYGPHIYNSRSGINRPENLDYSKVTRINYASFNIDDLGHIWEGDSNVDPIVLFGPHNWNSQEGDPTYCHKSSQEIQSPQCASHFYDKGLLGLSHMNGVKVFASIGVGGSAAEKKEDEEKMAVVFAKVASTDGARQEFAEQCAWLITNYKFDGIDIQWKYPQTLEDTANYVLLLNAVRQRLRGLEKFYNAEYGLTATLPCDDASNGQGEDIFVKHIPNFDSVLTELNLYTMDFHGPWGKTAGFNAPLYTYTDETDYSSVNGCVLKYLKSGASRSKLNVGIPFYGYSYKDSHEIGEECTPDWLGVCSDKVTWMEDNGSPTYHNIYDHLPSMPLYWDEETLTPIAYNDLGIVSYDDPKSICYKTEYIMMNKLNGVIIQELGDDMLLDKSTPLLDAVNFKALNLKIDCSGIDFENLFQWREVSFTPEYTSTNNGINANAEAVTEVGTVAMDLDDSKATFRYTCGFGEGDAKERCSNPGWNDINCDTGNCPEGMLCFVVECVKPKDYANSAQNETQAEIWVKSEPKPRPHRRPEKIASGETNAIEVNALSAETDTATIAATANANERAWACGSDYYDAAANCGASCQTLADCSGGEFCWFVECGVTPPATTTTSTPYSGPMVDKYQCGSDRDEAMTCQEECNGWSCDEGKDCYQVSCPP